MRERYTAYPRPILWLVPGGEVAVGGDEGDAAPRFTAVVAPFYLAKTPVENEQYEAFDPGYERSPLSPDDRDPALGVSWDDAAAYCAWYAEVARKPMRLPTEVEWEHACRAGAAGRWFWGDDPAAGDDFLWDRRNRSPDRVPPLAGKRANPFGLHAMLGGAWEWTASLYRPYPLAEGEVPPAGAAGEEDAERPASGRPNVADGSHASAATPDTPVRIDTHRVLRGGSWRMDRDEITCSLRRAEPPDATIPDAGFRIAKSLRG